MPKIAHVQVLPKLSGAQKFSLEILKNMEGWERYIICSGSELVSLQQKEAFITAMKQSNIEIIWVKSLKRNIGLTDLVSLFEFYRIFKKHNFDIVHTNSTKPGVTARIVARLAGVKKIIHTVHGIAYYKGANILKRTIYYLLEIFALQFGHYNITVNDFYLKYYRPFFWKKSFRIYNGVDFEFYSCKSNNFDAKKDSTNKRVLFVGRLDDQKNPLIALKAFQLLANKHANVKFDIVGDGDLREQCKQFVERNNLQSKVFFHGWIDDPIEFYKSADIFYCPSIYEAFGFTFVEAAFNELPIVASNVEGIPEVVKNEAMGLLCLPNDFYGQFNALEKILFNDELNKSYGMYGKNYVISNFAFPKTFDSYMKFYNS